MLSGCGVYDGSEITETTSMLISLSKHKATFQCYAPDSEQQQTVNHATGQELKQSRNILVESARIARGNIRPLNELNVAN